MKKVGPNIKYIYGRLGKNHKIIVSAIALK